LYHKLDRADREKKEDKQMAKEISPKQDKFQELPELLRQVMALANREGADEGDGPATYFNGKLLCIEVREWPGLSQIDIYSRLTDGTCDLAHLLLSFSMRQERWWVEEVGRLASRRANGGR
jgi:hypothetical protein